MAMAAQEEEVQASSLPRRLASVDKKVRDRAVDLLARWLECRQSVEESDLRKIWKGLFYCYWHSDKAPVQADLAEKLSSLLVRLPSDLGVRFFEEFLGTMRREWGGIDHLRLDKFYLLQRKFINAMFRALKQQNWDKPIVCRYMEALKNRSLLTKDLYPSQGSSMHLAEVFLTELSSIGVEEADVLGMLVEPFYSVVALSEDKILVNRVKQSVFNRLLKEATEEDGKDGFGRSVLCLPVDKKLFELASSADTPQSNRKLLYSLYEEFKKLKKNKVVEDKTNTDRVGNVVESDTKKKKKKKSPKAGEPDMKTENGVADSSVKKKSSKSPKSGTSSTKDESTPMEIEQVDEGDPVVSKLEKKFNNVAERDGSLPPLEMVLSPLIVGSRKKLDKKKKPVLNLNSTSDCTVVTSDSTVVNSDVKSDSPGKKRKRESSAFQVAVSPVNTASKKRKSVKESPESENSGGEATTSGKKAKKVRFALKRNTVWKPTSPRPFISIKSASLSMTPKSSALKKGLSPGPIRTASPKRASPKSKKPSPKRITRRNI